MKGSHALDSTTDMFPSVNWAYPNKSFVPTPELDFSRLPLKLEIFQTEYFIKAKEAERTALDQLLARSRYFIAPIRKLVPDVLDAIFEHCITDDPLAVWRLSGVTSSWRAIMLSNQSSSIWSKILLNNRVLALSEENCGALIQLWLQRSGDLWPLDIHFDLSDASTSQSISSKGVVSAFKLCLASISRWRRFAFVGNTEAFGPGDIHTSQRLSAPLLEHVQLSGESSYVRSQWLSHITGLSAPCLHTILLNDAKWWTFKEAYPALQHLRYVNRGYFDNRLSYSEVIGSLQLTPNIRTLVLSARAEAPSQHAMNAMQLLPGGFPIDMRACWLLPLLSLTSLEFTPNPLMPLVLQRLQMPQLQKVIFTCGRPHGDRMPTPSFEDVACLRNLVSQTPIPPISTLVFQYCVKVVDLGPHLALMDTLERLEIGISAGAGSFPVNSPSLVLNSLYEPLQDDGVDIAWALPRLKELVISIGRAEYDTRSRLEVWIEGRLVRRRACAELPGGPADLHIEINDRRTWRLASKLPLQPTKLTVYNSIPPPITQMTHGEAASDDGPMSTYEEGYALESGDEEIDLSEMYDGQRPATASENPHPMYCLPQGPLPDWIYSAARGGWIGAGYPNHAVYGAPSSLRVLKSREHPRRHPCMLRGGMNRKHRRDV